MSVNQSSSDNREVNLSEVSKKIREVYESFLSWIFRGFLFIKRNILILAVLFIVGAGLGFYLDKNTTVYNHEVIVFPNFGSTGYLYSKVNLIKARLVEGDNSFLKTIGIRDPKVVSDIEIVPVTDIYNLVSKNDKNFELIKLMAEDAEMSAIIEDKTTSLNYPYHTIKITTNKKVNEDVIEPLLKYFNESEYFTTLQATIVASTKKSITSDEKTIAQIDSLLSNFSNTSQLSKNQNLVYFNNENAQLNDVLKTKIDLNRSVAEKEVDLINMQKIIKDRSVIKNLKNNKSLNGKLKFIFPIIFIGLFLLFGIIRAFYRTQMKKMNS